MLSSCRLLQTRSHLSIFSPETTINASTSASTFAMMSLQFVELLVCEPDDGFHPMSIEH
jgi:hypothetical protein